MKTSMKLLHTALLVALSPSLGSALDVNGFTPDETRVYKTIGKDELRIHVFNPDDHAPSDKRPAVVFFFGGGWRGGSPSQFHPHCDYFASRGMVAMSAEYRVETHHGTSPRECVQDGKSVIRWIRRHADELGIDPQMLAAGGGSAGGHVAAATGTVNGFNEPGEDTAVSCRPDALVLFNPVFDNSPDGYGYERVGDYWQEFSPMHNIDSETPPSIIFLGTKDALIPVKTAERFKQLMTEAGVRCELFLYKDQGHGFFNHGRGDYFAKTVAETDRFLTSLGYIKPKPQGEETPQ